MTSLSKRLIRTLAERVIKQGGLATAVEAEQLARAVVLLTGGKPA